MQSFNDVGFLVLEKICKVFFTINERGCHLGHVTRTIYINFHSSFPRRLHMKFGTDWPSGFKGEDD